MRSIAISLAIKFVVRQNEKFKDSIDFVKLEKDLVARIKDLVPGTFFDEEAAKLVSFVIHWAQQVLEQGDNMKKLLKLLADKKFDEAVLLLKELILGSIVPANVAEGHAYSYVSLA